MRQQEIAAEDNRADFQGEETTRNSWQERDLIRQIIDISEQTNKIKETVQGRQLTC
jgi:hypothetical protein